MTSDPPASRDEAIAQLHDEYSRRTVRLSKSPERAAADLKIMRRAWNVYVPMLKRHGLFPIGQRSFADIGCGRNEFLVHLREQWGQRDARLSGNDLMADRVEQGMRDYPYLDLVAGSADQLPWPDGTFDIVHQSGLVSSILEPKMRRGIAAEMARICKPDGWVIWYDFVWNPLNKAARGVNLAELRTMFPDWEFVDRRRSTLPPPLSRAIDKVFSPLVDWLEALRVFNAWELVLLKRKTGRAAR